jgi:hypothetical protein
MMSPSHGEDREFDSLRAHSSELIGVYIPLSLVQDLILAQFPVLDVLCPSFMGIAPLP